MQLRRYDRGQTNTHTQTQRQIDRQTDRQTDRHAHHSTPLFPIGGGVITCTVYTLLKGHSHCTRIRAPLMCERPFMASPAIQLSQSGCTNVDPCPVLAVKHEMRSLYKVRRKTPSLLRSVIAFLILEQKYSKTWHGAKSI